MRILLPQIYIGRRMRKDYGPDDLMKLSADLTENGQITAITVRPISDYDKAEPEWKGEPWALVAGGRRYMAAGLAGWSDIEAFEREEMKELTHRVLELHENLLRKPMAWKEEVEAKAEILRLRRVENPNITAGEVAAELGQHASTFSRDLETAEVLKSNPTLRNAGSKHAALTAGKELKKHAAREEMKKSLAKATVADASPPLETRVQTSEALDFVRSLPTASIDLALLDGPYGYGYFKIGQKDRNAGQHLSTFDDSPEAAFFLYEAMLPELVRVVRPTGWLVMFAGFETYQFLDAAVKELCSDHYGYRTILDDPAYISTRCSNWKEGSNCTFLRGEPFPWIWFRPNSRNPPRYAHLHAWNVTELIFATNMGKARILEHPMPNLFQHEADYGEDRIHVNQKPQPLAADIIKHLTFTGDSVLDCFFGSGNILAAAASLGRVPYGCDKNPDMLAFAHGRIQEVAKPVTAEAIQASHDRYRKRIEEGEATPEEEPVA